MSESGDARNLSGKAQAVLRERGVRMLLDGATHTHVAAVMGVSLSTVALWSARFRVGGMEGLRERRRGRRPGEQMALSVDQQAEIVRSMVGRNPDQLHIEGVLWSRAAVKALIERKFGIVLTRQAVGNYLRRWRVSAKKPQKRWLEQDPERVRAWLEREYPAIQARAKRARAGVGALQR